MFHHIAWAMTADTPDALSRWLLVVIADHTNQDGVSWPSIATLAKRTGMGTSTVCRKLNMLERAGLITRNSGYEGKSTRYHLVIPEKDKAIPERGNPAPQRETKLPVNNNTLSQLPPEDWQPAEEVITSINDIAFRAGKEVNHDIEVFKFVSYCQANNKQYKNLTAAYRSWCARVISGSFTSSPSKNAGVKRDALQEDAHGRKWGEYLSAVASKVQ